MTPTPRETMPRLDLVALFGALAMLLALELVAAWYAGWVFEYPLDDVYIHMAMASEIARGGYGVNSGEIASAASSALYPLLLTLFPDSELQRWTPLLLNVIGLAATAYLWGRALSWAGYSGGVGLGLAFFGPILWGGVSTAYLGMEHTLHAASALAVVYGLARMLAEGRGALLLILGMAIGPALRLEGLALSGMAALVLALRGQWTLAITGGLLALLPVAAFMWYLTSLGLDPLPESVQAKLTARGEAELGRLQRIAGTVYINLAKPGGQSILLLTLVVMAMRMFSESIRTSRWNWFSIALVAAGLGHILFGQVGWMERYEHYIIAALAAATVILAPRALPSQTSVAWLSVLAMLGAGWFYAKETATFYYWSSRAIHLQQGQMARFAQDHLNRNVAVNDLGRVAWGNPNYVLDLFGLSNAEARALRLSDAPLGWGGPLVEKHGVEVIMIYDEVKMAGTSVAPEWVKLGKLVMRHAVGYLGGAEVDFYAANETHVAHAMAALREWAPTTPPDACFVFEGEDQCAR